MVRREERCELKPDDIAFWGRARKLGITYYCVGTPLGDKIKCFHWESRPARWIRDLMNLRAVYLRQKSRYPRSAEKIKEDMEKLRRRIRYALDVTTGEEQGKIVTVGGRAYLCDKAMRRVTCSRIRTREGERCALSIPD